MTHKQDSLNVKGRTGLRAILCLGVGLGAIGVAMPALAQDNDETVNTGTERRLGAVVVNATRREGVTVQDVPIAVTALDAALLEDSGVQRINDLEQIAPTIQITQGQSSATGTSISIRGIGTGSDNPGFEPAVGVFIDGVYRTKTGIALGDLPELASIEVLRGPQGTLFGRNTSSGALSITTAGPDREPGASIGVTFGNFSAKTFEGMLTGPLGETTSARLDFKVRQRDGYVDDVNSDRAFNNIDRTLLRGQFKWEDEDASLRVIADYAETDENCCTAVNLIAGNPAAPTVPAGIGVAVNTVAGLGGLTGIASPGNPEAYQVAASPNRDLQEDVRDKGISAEYNNRLGIGNLTSITAWRDWSVDRNQDIDFSGADRAYRDGYSVNDTMFSQEFRLQNTWQNVDWLIGAYYLNESLELTDTVRFGTQANLYLDAVSAGATAIPGLAPGGFQLTGSFGPALPSLFVNVPGMGPVVRFGFDPNIVNSLTIANNFPAYYLPTAGVGQGQNADSYSVDTTAFALFTHNQISFGDRTTLTVGLRYNSEDKDLSYDLDATVPFCSFLFTPEGQSVLGQLNAIGAASLAVLGCNPTVNSEFNGTGSDTISAEEITGTLSLSYKLSDDLMVYGGYSRGFKSGGWNLDRGSFDTVLFGGNGAQPSDLAFDPETVDAYELGWKYSFLDGKGTLNGALFFQEIDGYQFNTFVGTNFVTYNTQAESKGIELDLGLTPVDGLILQGGFAYTDATYQSDPIGAGFLGEQITNIPKYVFTGAATYTMPIGETGLEGLFHLNFRYNDSVETTFEAYTPLAQGGLGEGGPTGNDSYALVNARIGVQSADGKWSVSLFGENLTEEYYNLTTFPVPEQPGVYTGYPALPRFYGIEAKLNF